MTEVKNLQGEVIQEHNTFAPNKPNATWQNNPNVTFGDYPKNKFDWSQMFQLDTQQGADFMEGFNDENFVAMAMIIILIHLHNLYLTQLIWLLKIVTLLIDGII